jgi:hypothetical protein
MVGGRAPTPQVGRADVEQILDLNLSRQAEGAKRYANSRVLLCGTPR